MPFITNVSMSKVVSGSLPQWTNSDTVLIQIQDVDTEKFANVRRRSRFVSVYGFRFDDTDVGDNVINDSQAHAIGTILKDAFGKGLNVIVHCHAGLCRSGAVTEVGVMYGFEDIHKNPRIPNTTVKTKLRKVLGLVNSWE